MTTLEQEFQDFAECQKHEILKQKLVDYYETIIAPYDLSECPDFIQEMVTMASTALASLKLESLKNTGIHNLIEQANNAWEDELKKVGLANE